MCHGTKFVLVGSSWAWDLPCNVIICLASLHTHSIRYQLQVASCLGTILCLLFFPSAGILTCAGLVGAVTVSDSCISLLCLETLLPWSPPPPLILTIFLSPLLHRSLMLES